MIVGKFHFFGFDDISIDLSLKENMKEKYGAEFDDSCYKFVAGQRFWYLFGLGDTSVALADDEKKNERTEQNLTILTVCFSLIVGSIRNFLGVDDITAAFYVESESIKSWYVIVIESRRFPIFLDFDDRRHEDLRIVICSYS